MLIDSNNLFRGTWRAALLLCILPLAVVRCAAIRRQQDGTGAIAGRLTQDGLPIANAEVDLQKIRDAECAQLFNFGNPGKTSKLPKGCVSQDVHEAPSDADGRYRITGLAPGIYAIHILWNANSVASKTPQLGLFGDFQVDVPGRLDLSGRFDAFAQGLARPIGPGETLTQDLAYRAAPPQPSQDAPVRGMISLPDKNWGLVLQLPGFVVTKSETQADGRRYMMAENKTSGVIVSVFLEEEGPARKTQSCRQDFEGRIKHPPLPLTNPRITESGDKTFFDYTATNLLGSKQSQGNRLMCEVHDGVFIDLHLSKMDFQPQDEKLFESMSFQEGVARSALQMIDGARPFLQRMDFDRAIPPLAQALSLEQQKPQLDKKDFLAMIDMLGLGYLLKGQPEKSRESFQYGIQRFPDDPLLYYGMACYYAEKHDSANTLDYLQKTFERKANLVFGASMPNPMKDGFFKTLLKDKAFREKVNSIINGS